MALTGNEKALQSYWFLANKKQHLNTGQEKMSNEVNINFLNFRFYPKRLQPFIWVIICSSIELLCAHQHFYILFNVKNSINYKLQTAACSNLIGANAKL